MTNYVKNNNILANCGKIVSLDIEENKKLEKLKKECENNQSQECNNYNEKENDNKKDPFRKFYKYSLDGNDKLLIIVNITDKKEQLDTSKYEIRSDISLDNRIEDITETIEILPYQLKIFTTRERAYWV